MNKSVFNSYITTSRYHSETVSNVNVIRWIQQIRLQTQLCAYVGNYQNDIRWFHIKTKMAASVAYQWKRNIFTGGESGRDVPDSCSPVPPEWWRVQECHRIPIWYVLRCHALKRIQQALQ